MVSILRNTLLVAFLLTITVIALTNVSTAMPPPIVIPTLPPTGGGGSSGGGSSSGSHSSGSSTPAFVPYNMTLYSSDHSAIGALVGKDYNTVLLTAEKNETIGGRAYDLLIVGVLSQKPPDGSWLDIDFLAPDQANIPAGMASPEVLAVVNVTHYTGYDWGFKSNTLAFSFNLSGPDPNTAGIYYLVWPDGSKYVLQNINVENAGSDTLTVNVNPPGDSGQFTLIYVKPGVPSATPVPTAAPTVKPTAAPTAAPSDNGMTYLATWLTIFVIGVVAGAAVLFILMKFR